jgi:hypothetical protein
MGCSAHTFIRVAAVSLHEQSVGLSKPLLAMSTGRVVTNGDQWFSIMPKDGQWENAFKWDRRARVVILPETSGE